MDKYIHYTAIELAQVDSFIRWAKESSAKGSEEDWSAWLQQHPERAAVVQEAKSIVETMAFRQPNIDTEVEERLWQNINQKTRSSSRSGSNIIRLLSYGAAAAIALLILFTVLVSPYDTTIQTSYADSKSITLPDGSSVVLNADSKLEYDAETWDEKRLLALEGEAFFQVEKGARFTVETPSGEVTVLGTSFNVFARGDDLFVQCETGKVGVSSKANETILMASESVKVQNGVHQTKTTFVEEGRRSQWQNGIFSFKNTKLSVVVKELERHLNVTIKIDNQLLDQLYTGSFNTANGQQAASEVFWPLNLQFTQDKNTITVTE